MTTQLSGAQKAKWHRLKGEIIKRPLLAFTIGLDKNEAQTILSNGFPDQKRLDEIDSLLIEERKRKTERLRSTLTRVVGHRGSGKFAEKIGTDGMTIKYIIDRRGKKVPSFDLIAKIEIHLSYVTDFEISFENQPDAIKYLEKSTECLRTRTFKVADELKALNLHFIELNRFDKKSKQHFVVSQRDSWKINHLQYVIKSAIDELNSVQANIETIITDYLVIQD